MKIAIYGRGGHAIEVYHQIKDTYSNSVISFVVDDQHYNNQENTIPFSYFKKDEQFNDYYFIIAIGDSKIRNKIVDKLPKNIKYFTFIHHSAILLDRKTIKIGEGSFVGANCILTTNIEIGKHTILNRSVNVGHDCKIRDYFSAMPNVVISGNVKIGNNVYCGNNSSVKEKIEICNNVIVGMNAAVVKNIETGGTYVGVPAKKIK